MNVYHSDPQLALTTLEKIAEEIPSGVSAAEAGEILTTAECPKELIDGLQAAMTKELKSSLNEFWDSQNVNQKLEEAKNFNQHKKDIRGCLSPQDLANVIIAKNLQLLKDKLAVKIQKLDEENQSLETCLSSKVELINKQMTAVKSRNFLL